MSRSALRVAQLSRHLILRAPIGNTRHLYILNHPTKMSHLYEDATPAEVKNAKVPLIASNSRLYGEPTLLTNETLRVFISLRWALPMARKSKSCWKSSTMSTAPNGRKLSCTHQIPLSWIHPLPYICLGISMTNNSHLSVTSWPTNKRKTGSSA